MLWAVKESVSAANIATTFCLAAGSRYACAIQPITSWPSSPQAIAGPDRNATATIAIAAQTPTRMCISFDVVSHHTRFRSRTLAMVAANPSSGAASRTNGLEPG